MEIVKANRGSRREDAVAVAAQQTAGDKVADRAVVSIDLGEIVASISRRTSSALRHPGCSIRTCESTASCQASSEAPFARSR
jgi:hypothetical protein